MLLTDTQLEAFRTDGFVAIPSAFSADEVAALNARLPVLFEEGCPENIRERSSGVVRTAMGLHRRDPLFGELVRDPRFVGPARQILGEVPGDDAFYVQQVKVNAKEAFTGEQWQWHYDFATHHHFDGVPEPLALNLHIFLDEVTEFNGPLVFIPGSHRHGPAPTSLDTTTTSYPLWTVPTDAVTLLAADRGLVSPKGPAGTMLIFGDALVHGSPGNLSPWGRRIFSLIVNPVRNRQRTFARADHLHHSDFAPVEMRAGSFRDSLVYAPYLGDGP